MKKRGFTLIEMIIVIVIIAILLALSLGISGNRIQSLKNKSIQEQFAYKYNSLFSRNLLTNYYNGELYDKMTIHLNNEGNSFTYHYKHNEEDIFSDNDGIQGGKYKVINLHFDGEENHPLQSVDINFEPYVLGCELSGGNKTGQILKVKLYVNDNENYCIKINSDLCKLEKESCL